jgi:hypothetical protein
VNNDGGPDSDVEDAKPGAADRRSLSAVFSWASGGEGRIADFLPRLRAGGLRSEALKDARNWAVSWRCFVAASGAKLGFDQVESDSVLKARFRSLYVRAAMMKAQELRDDTVMFVGSTVVSYGCMTALAALVAADPGGAAVLTITAFCALFVLHRILLAFLKASAGGHWSVVFGCALMAAGSVGVAMLLARHWFGYERPFAALPVASGYPAAVAAGVVTGFAGLPISIVGVLLASTIGSSIVGRRRMRNHPDAIVFGAFVEILSYLDSGPAKLASLAARRATAQNFERAARAVEYGLYHALRLSDSGNDLAVQNKLQAIASMIRTHQVSFVLSEKIALLELSNLSVRTIRSVCLGALGSLPVPSSSATAASGLWRSLLASLHNLAAALVPSAVVAALAWRNVLSADAFGRTAVVAAATWAVVSLLLTVNPLSADRLSGPRDLVSALRGDVRNTK